MIGKPLTGVRVIEHGTFITGPAAGMFLADLGADVIKLEKPDTGDPFRAFKGGLYSANFQAYNRNKRSVALDTRNEQDYKIFAELLRSADVYIQNFRPSAAQKLKVDEPSLRALNPKLIYCAISGFGDSGPYEERPSYDSVAQALSGYMHLLLNPGNPRIIGPAIADAITGFYAAYGVLGALFKRSTNDAGVTLEVSMLEAMAHFNIDAFTHYFANQDIMGPYSRPRASQSYAVQCADGKWLALHMSSPEKFWQGLATVMEQPDLFKNEIFATRQARLDNYEEVNKHLLEVFRRHPRSHWCTLLEKHDVPHANINNTEEALNDPHFQHMQIAVSAQHPVMGEFRTIRSPVNYDGQRATDIKAPPTLNEHYDEIIAELNLQPPR